MIHQDQLAEFGGAQGVRDPGLLSSAIAQPSATFGGVFLHSDLHEMAAANLYHLTMNHPFVDGNKRTAFIAALTFLDLNGVDIEHDPPGLYELAVAVAEGRVDKHEIARVLGDRFPSSLN